MNREDIFKSYVDYEKECPICTMIMKVVGQKKMINRNTIQIFLFNAHVVNT